MRKNLLIWAICGLSGLLNSQNLNVAWHESNDRANGLVQIGGRSFFIQNSEAYCCNKGSGLWVIDKSGEFVTGTSLGFNGGWSDAKLMIKSLDNHIVVAAYSTKACDLIGQDSYLVKIDTNGAIVFKTVFQVGSLLTQHIDLVQHPDSSYYFASQTQLVHFSKSGQFLSKISTGLTDIKCLSVLSDGNFVLHGTSNGGITNIKMSPSGQMLKQQSSAMSIYNFKEISTGRLISRNANGCLEKYDGSLNFIKNSAAVLTSNYRITDFTVRNDSLFAVGYLLPLKSPFSAILDSSLHLISQSVSGYRNIVPAKISLDKNNNISTINNCTSEVQEDYPFTSFYRCPLTSIFSSSLDVGVDSFSILGKTLTVQDSHRYPSYDFTVIMKNYGQIPVDSFYLDHFEKYTWCIIPLHKLIKKTLFPGDTMVIDVHYNGGPFLTSQLPTSVTAVSANFCLYTTVPNGQNDNDISNDSYCSVVSFDITDLEENSLDKLSIFPNPFNSTIKITSPQPVMEISIYDMMGRLLLTEPMNKMEIELSPGLDPGVYFLRIESEKGTVTKKVVKL